MAGNTRKLHYKHIKDTAAEHVGHKGDIWYDPNTTDLRFYSGSAGGTVLSAGGSSYDSNLFIDYGSLSGSGNVAIDLTKKYHWLVDLGAGNHYTLADGSDGQVLEFYASYGLVYGGAEQSDIYVATLKYFADAGASTRYESGARIVRLFGHNQTTNTCTKVTATWLNGAWHLDANIEDLGSF